jgi:hypothetical protein
LLEWGRLSDAGSESGTYLFSESYLLDRQTGPAAVETIKKGSVVMKTQKAAGAKNARKLSDAIIEKRYLDLQKLRDAVRKAEISCAPQTLKNSQRRKRATQLVSSPPHNTRQDFGEQR